MDLVAFIGHVEREGAALAAAARGHLDARVPSCPDWDVAALVAHVGGVHRFWGECLRSGRRVDVDDVVRQPPDGGALLEWYDMVLSELVETLRDVDPAKPTWNWSRGPQVASWVHRRMAHETAVHRWDAEAAANGPEAIDAELAADGIDEFLTVHLDADLDDPDISDPGQRETDEALRSVHGSLHLHCTDVGGEWLAHLEAGPTLMVERVHAKGDVAARGSASDLLLVLWGRMPSSSVEVLGDASLLDAWRSLVAT